MNGTVPEWGVSEVELCFFLVPIPRVALRLVSGEIFPVGIELGWTAFLLSQLHDAVQQHCCRLDIAFIHFLLHPQCFSSRLPSNQQYLHHDKSRFQPNFADRSGFDLSLLSILSS
jgi:hypothetical protein